jgi:hypothetical protein
MQVIVGASIEHLCAHEEHVRRRSILVPRRQKAPLLLLKPLLTRGASQDKRRLCSSSCHYCLSGVAE